MTLVILRGWLSLGCASSPVAELNTSVSSDSRSGGEEPQDRPEVVVGIVSWNTAEHLDACLSALPHALGDLDADVVVVDNASQDHSADVARRHGVRVITNDSNRGYAAAMNQALSHRPAPYLLALNPDTRPAPGTLERLVKHLRQHPSAGVAVPLLVSETGQHQPSAYRFPGPIAPLVASMSTERLRRSWVGRRLLLEGSAPHGGGRVDWAIGAVHLIRASALRGEDPYSERSFMYAEDLDLCWRLAQRGWSTIMVDDVSVTHVGNVAGEMAWGDGRSPRYFAATYDVIAQRRSAAAARWVGLWWSIAAIISILRTMPRLATGSANHARQLIRMRTRELVVHAKAAVHGPPNPPTSPPDMP